MEKITDKKSLRTLTIVLFCVYMVSYITRINFGTIISEMEKVTKIPRDLLSMSITGSFITYGLGQIISGICGDKIAPKKLISLGLITTVVMNTLIPLCKSPYLMLVIWCINGFAQSFMWPPLVVIMVTLFDSKGYSKASTIVASYGAAIGTIILYLISPLLITLFNWKAVFFFAAICGILMLLALNALCPDVAPQQKEKTNKHPAQNSKWLSVTLVFIMTAIIFLGMLRDGVTTWMPTYISEVYDISNIISILSGALLPIFHIICSAIALTVYLKYIKNPVTCAGVFFGISTIFAIVLIFSKNAILSVIAMAIITGASHGSNLMLISMLPAFFKKTGKVSTVSGVLNSFVYVGSAVSTYGIALLSKNFDWSYTVLTWIGGGLIGTLICFSAAKNFIKKYGE